MTMGKFVTTPLIVLSLMSGVSASSAADVPAQVVGNWLMYMGSGEGKAPSEAECAKSNQQAQRDNLEFPLSIPAKGDWRAGDPSGEGTHPLEGSPTITSVRPNGFNFVVEIKVYRGEYPDKTIPEVATYKTPGDIKIISKDVIKVITDGRQPSNEYYCRNGK